MNWWEILLLVVVCIAFVVALGIVIYNKIKGKSGCDCGGSCGSCGGCGAKKPEQNSGACPHCASHKDNKDET